MARVRVRTRTEEAPERASELAATFSAIDKRYGAGVVRIAKQVPQPDRIPTGVFTLDYATLGGIPVSRATMIVGNRSAGKSTLASLIMGQAQRVFPDQTPVLEDIEDTFDTVWASKLGADMGSLPIVSPETGEMAVDIGIAVLQSMETSLLVVDSVAALTPFKEQEDSAEDAHVGLQARLVSRFIRRMTAAMIAERRRGHAVTILFLNQFRTKIGGFAKFGEPRSIPGGRAVEFCTSLQVEIKNKENQGKDAHGRETVTHNEHPFTVLKNKLNNGPRTGEFVLIRADTDTGLREGDIDDAETILSYAKKEGLWTGSGKNQALEFEDYRYRFEKIAQGVQALREDDGLRWALRTYLIQEQAARLGMSDEFIERIR